ncbi:Lrp/AsnC family transcriptional regulator [Desulfuribacillus alkaliarsenatis]|uniref:AsnC family transcriptional regulator n=1 Tax=Desulfuribacillus alkaliarsenatis TaxID=766136 RepID=A0A1E5G5X3_9FIRM|nr:Lrp/AsnC family transcriptional regulator [Desulfuribacillus alkaliarsenatis]OEF98509.1 AsnC family transcriptional regulator [Desulfuribacillus alkaliarsenatis]
MTELQLKVLQLLKENSKITAKEIASMLDQEVEAIEQLIQDMEADGTIVKYTAIVNWEKVASEQVIAMIDVKVAPKRGQGFDALAERIYRFPEVQSVYLMSGSYDLSVVVEGNNLKQLAEFVSARLSPLEDVVSTTTHFILKKYKENGVILNDKEKDQRLVVSP